MHAAPNTARTPLQWVIWTISTVVQLTAVIVIWVQFGVVRGTFLVLLVFGILVIVPTAVICTCRQYIAWRMTRRILHAFQSMHGVEYRAWPLRYVPNAIALCTTWRIAALPNPPHALNPPESCSVCNAAACIVEFVPVGLHPRVYNILIARDPFTGRILDAAERQRHRILPFVIPGTKRRLAFCSQECYASALLCALAIPTTTRQRIWRRWMLMTAPLQRVIHHLFG